VATTWFSGVCDSLLQRIVTWEEKYEAGNIYATRQYLTETFEQQDLPVQFVHDVPFSLAEMQNLVRILQAEKPKWTITADFVTVLGLLTNPKARQKKPAMIRTLQNGMFVIALVFEKKEIHEIRELLEFVKGGCVVAPTTAGFQTAWKKSGKGMWQ
jgi:hypothetical protein